MKRTSLAFFRMVARSSDEQVSSESALAAGDALDSDARQRAEIRRLRKALNKVAFQSTDADPHKSDSFSLAAALNEIEVVATKALASKRKAKR
jgi:hypothetical protein